MVPVGALIVDEHMIKAKSLGLIFKSNIDYPTVLYETTHIFISKPLYIEWFSMDHKLSGHCKFSF